MVLVGCVFGVGTVAWSDRSPDSALMVSAPAPTTTTTTAPPTTTTTTEPPAANPDQPIAVPGNSYAREKIVEFGTIEIPKLGLNHRTYQGVTLNNIDRGPAHWPGTALPGQRGNTVFAGHRVTNSRPFRHIDQLVAGDQVIFTHAGTRSVYRVTGNQVVRPQDTWIADQTSAFTGTLYACHPPGSAAYRFVVRLELVDPPGASAAPSPSPGATAPGGGGLPGEGTTPVAGEGGASADS